MTGPVLQAWCLPEACMPLQMSTLYEWLARAIKPAQASPEAAAAQRRMCEAFSQKPLLWLSRKPLQPGDRLKDSWRANLQPGAFYACQRQVSATTTGLAGASFLASMQRLRVCAWSDQAATSAEWMFHPFTCKVHLVHGTQQEPSRGRLHAPRLQADIYGCRDQSLTLSCACMMMMQVRLRDPAGFIEQLPERDFQLRILSAYYTSPALLLFFSEQLVWPQALQESSAAAGAALGGQPVERQLVMPERSPDRDGAAAGVPSSAGQEGSQTQPASAPASHQTSGDSVQLLDKEGNPKVAQQQSGAAAASAIAAEQGHSDMELDPNAGTPQQGLHEARVSVAAAAAAVPGADQPVPAAASRPSSVGGRPGGNPSPPGTSVHLVMQGPAMVAPTPSDAEYCQALSLLISAAARGDPAAGREVMQRVLAVFNMWGARLASHPTTSAPDAGPLRSLMKMVQVGTSSTQTAMRVLCVPDLSPPTAALVPILCPAL